MTVLRLLAGDVANTTDPLPPMYFTAGAGAAYTGVTGATHETTGAGENTIGVSAAHTTGAGVTRCTTGVGATCLTTGADAANVTGASAMHSTHGAGAAYPAHQRRRLVLARGYPTTGAGASYTEGSGCHV